MRNALQIPKKVLYIGSSTDSFTKNQEYFILAIYSTEDVLVKDNYGIKTIMYNGTFKIVDL